jgi:hypothetical protein
MSGKRLATLSFSLALALVGVVAVLWLPVLSKVEGLGASQVALAQSGTGIIRAESAGNKAGGQERPPASAIN